MADQILREQWAVDVAVRVRTIRHLARIAAAHRQTDDHQKAVIATVDEFLDTAQQAVQRRRGLPRGPLERWRGTSVALAHQSLHAAEVFVVDVISVDQIDALVPTIVTRAHLTLGPADPRRVAIDRLPQLVADRAAGMRAAVKQAMRIVYGATDEMHAQVRNFRNLLILSAALITVLMAILLWVVALRPGAMPMCFAPNTAPTEAPLTVCPSGLHHPTGGDVLIVAGLGLLGGALAAAFSIRNVRGTSTPYDVPIATALLKPPLGALTAVSAILLLGGDFVPGFSRLDTQQQILAYALVFGYAQQLVSRFIDDQGQNILNRLPSKDTAAKGATPFTPTEPDSGNAAAGSFAPGSAG